MAVPAWASSDKAFLAAREAYQQARMERFEQRAARLARDHVLRPYIDYWRLKGNGASPEQRLAFVEANADSPLSDLMRQDLARQAAKGSDWTAVLGLLAQVEKPDAELRCLGYQARMRGGDGQAAGEFAAQYTTSRDLPSACENLYEELFAQKLLGLEHRHARLRHALEGNNLRLAREINARLPAEAQFAESLLDTLRNAPEDLVVMDTGNAAQRELVLHALSRVAKEDPDAAAMLWESVAQRHAEDARRYGWGQIAAQAAYRHHPRGLEWYALAGDALSENQAVWKARAALRQGDWPSVFAAINALPAETRETPAWRYWKARALRALNVGPVANQMFAKLSREPHYYGLLAEEELPVRLEKRSEDQPVSAADVDAVSRLPGMVRALELRRLGLTVDAVAEWNWALRGAEDGRLLAAAELARREGWYDRAIATAERTRELHNFDLRYLTPFRDLARTYASQNELDEAWVYGLIRQESRFMGGARSSAGAQGLMQVMPATARWIAHQLGLGRNAHKGIYEPDTNLRFGTYYLKRSLDNLQGSPVLATAGYNAGPGRARRWQAEVPLEGAVYIETIPFTETRDYVKKVMANALFYSQRLGLKQVALKDRLGTVPARPVQAAERGADPAG
jgi:soluble lytic murein transglycosylase